MKTRLLAAQEDENIRLVVQIVLRERQRERLQSVSGHRAIQMIAAKSTISEILDYTHILM